MKPEKKYYTELFKQIANGQKIILNQETSKHGITYVQAVIVIHLMRIREQYGPAHEVSQKDIEKMLYLRGSTVTNILCRMEASGFLKRKRSQRDNRSNCVSLTQKGVDFVPVFFDLLGHVERTITKGMTEEEKAQLMRLLQKAAANLTNTEE